ncbi:stress response protein, partial [Litorilinea aerophila]
FYRLRQSGGTKISSALELCHRLLLAHYPVADWNIYLFQFSDGENFEQDNRVALELLREQLLPMANLYCYGQVNDLHYRDTFIDALNRLDAPDNLVSTRIPDEEAIYQALKVFLGKGR